MVIPGTVSGRPARSAAIRAMLAPCSASGIAQPRITSSISLVSNCGACSSRAPMTVAAMSSRTRRPQSSPGRFPHGGSQGVHNDSIFHGGFLSFSGIAQCSDLVRFYRITDRATYFRGRSGGRLFVGLRVSAGWFRDSVPQRRSSSKFHAPDRGVDGSPHSSTRRVSSFVAAHPRESVISARGPLPSKGIDHGRKLRTPVAALMRR